MLGQVLCLTAQLWLLPGQTEQPGLELTSPNQVTSLLPQGLQLHLPGRSGDLAPCCWISSGKGSYPWGTSPWMHWPHRQEQGTWFGANPLFGVLCHVSLSSGCGNNQNINKTKVGKQDVGWCPSFGVDTPPGRGLEFLFLTTIQSAPVVYWDFLQKTRPIICKTSANWEFYFFPHQT